MVNSIKSFANIITVSFKISDWKETIFLSWYLFTEEKKTLKKNLQIQGRKDRTKFSFLFTQKWRASKILEWIPPHTHIITYIIHSLRAESECYCSC